LTKSAANGALTGFWTCLAQIGNPLVYKNFMIHLFVMIPAAVVMSLFGKEIDRVVGLEPFLSAPWTWIAAICLFGLGGLIVVYTYGYLTILGRGSPGTHVDGGPRDLVVTGPYTAVRHPSVLGKLSGVIGLGFLTGSTVFTFIIIPLLLVYSLITNRYLQERGCEEKFGEDYARYRAAVPMLVPRPAGIRRFLSGAPAIELRGER
jgi:protein-S-isoprenylcysteine O-methyltransferase Ste14